MKTDELITLLVADRRAPSGFLLWSSSATAMAVVLTAAAFWSFLGLRVDFDAALGTLRFPFKLLVTFTLAISTLPLLWMSARPQAELRRYRWWLTIAPALIVMGVTAELLTQPAISWGERLVGTNALLCLTAIPLLSVVPLGIFLLALRRGAPAHPRLTGALAGLSAGGIAATLYAIHCFDDSPLFVVVWYSLGIAVVTVVATALGGRLLRW